uniref:Gluconolactonase (Precursor) putative n=1 Tax=Albugo laibachii Nc14 TaxID=890382 RepID=F0WLD1_9STRA|nr:gluconolactonase (precursor) putative [Albugo laibachii Nc14]|eukprot:CCA22094.1 gluconolactonase (precursor) putative [Albugo laibachii Nc14]
MSWKAFTFCCTTFVSIFLLCTYCDDTLNQIGGNESYSSEQVDLLVKLIIDDYSNYPRSGPKSLIRLRPPVYTTRMLASENDSGRSDLEKQARAVYPLYRETHNLETSKGTQEDFNYFYRVIFPKLMRRANKLLKIEDVNKVKPKIITDSNPRSDDDTTESKGIKGEDLSSMGRSRTSSANAYKKNHLSENKKDTGAVTGSMDTSNTKKNPNKLSTKKILPGQLSVDIPDKEKAGASVVSKTLVSPSEKNSAVGRKPAAKKDATVEDMMEIVDAAVAQTGTKPSASKLGSSQDKGRSSVSGTLDTSTGTMSASGVASGTLRVNTIGSTMTLSSKLSFITKIYTPELAGRVASLRDNTKNMQTVVQSTQGNQAVSSTRRNRLLLQGPVVVTGLEGPQGRHLMSEMPDFTIFFCDVNGNAVWKWDREARHDVFRGKTDASHSNSTESKNANFDRGSDICTDASVTVTVSAYQSGCSRQNHPEGCEDVYYKGCGGLTINPLTNRVVVARTGGRTIGTMSFKKVGGICQGRIVDAITHYRGRKFNSPTYVEYTSAGVLYFTDSPLGFANSLSDLDNDTFDTSPLREIPFNGVYWLQNVSNATVALADCSMDRPNKIAFSPEEDTMYITNSRRGNSYVKAFDINSDGSIGSSRIFFNFTVHPELDTDEGYAEGIKVDSTGNVYVVAYKAVHIFDPNGTIIGVLVSSQRINDLVFGNGQIFITGEFGIVAQLGNVLPATPIRQTALAC